jgi:steroid delta-isomerase-like uncharacterized protein
MADATHDFLEPFLLDIFSLTFTVNRRTLATGATGRGVMGVGKDLWTEMEAQYNKGDSGWASSFYAPDSVYLGPDGRYEGREVILAYYADADRPFSDIRMDTTLLVEEGDTVVAEYTWRATNTGPLTMPTGTEIPATGKTLALSGVSVITVRDGQISSQRDYFDTASMASQLGLMPNT